MVARNVVFPRVFGVGRVDDGVGAVDVVEALGVHEAARAVDRLVVARERDLVAGGSGGLGEVPGPAFTKVDLADGHGAVAGAPPLADVLGVGHGLEDEFCGAGEGPGDDHLRPVGGDGGALVGARGGCAVDVLMR